jgi:hypothetical protein
VIYAYGDDGSGANHERVIAVSIIFGYEQWWQELEDQWVVRCGGIPFHATDCESNPPRGDYRGRLSHDEAKALYRDLTGILASSRLGGVGVGMDLVAKRRVFPNAPPIDYYRAFLECLQHAAGLAERVGEICEITYDVSKENEANAALLYGQLRESEERFRRWLHPKLSFESCRDSARLQAADLLAFEAWKALDHTVGPIQRKRQSWKLLRATGQFETFSYSEEWFRDLKEHLDSGELEKIVGFNEDDYKAWLAKTGRQHNTTNLFEFTRIGKKSR